MTTTLLNAWQAQTAADVTALDAELGELLAAVRAFKAKAAKVTGRAQRTAERIASALHDAADARQGDAATEVLLDKLAELPSGDPDDTIGGAVDALVEYRGTLAALAREVAAISG
jgi:hypothetical protein